MASLDGLGNFQRDLAKQQRDIQRSLSKNQRDIQKSLASQQRAMSKIVGLDIKREGRVPVKADLRKKVYAKYHNKCNYPKCIINDTNYGGKVLQIHHIDMDNTHTYLSNLELICPTHHKIRHNEKFRKTIKKGNFLNGFKTEKRLVTKAQNKELNKKKAKQKRESSWGLTPIKISNKNFDFRNLI